MVVTYGRNNMFPVSAEIATVLQDWQQPRPVQTSWAAASALERASQSCRAVGPFARCKTGPQNQDFEWFR